MVRLSLIVEEKDAIALIHSHLRGFRKSVAIAKADRLRERWQEYGTVSLSGGGARNSRKRYGRGVRNCF